MFALALFLVDLCALLFLILVVGKLFGKFKKVRIRTVAVFGIVGIVGIFIQGSLKASQTETRPPAQEMSVAEDLPVFTREELWILTNERRVEKGKNSLSLDSVLNDTAQAKCEDMAARNEFEHGNIQNLADDLQRTVGENLTYGSSTAEEVIWNWVDSPSHYENILDDKWKNVGFGMCPFRDEVLVVQHFSD